MTSNVPPSRPITMARAFPIRSKLRSPLITNARTAFAFLRQFENVVPIWGIQRESELDEFLALDADPPVLDDKLRAVIEKDRAELAGDFCRGCGYCLPCPVEIPINNAARMSLLMRRAPTEGFLSERWREMMARINDTYVIRARPNDDMADELEELLRVPTANAGVVSAACGRASMAASFK